MLEIDNEFKALIPELSEIEFTQLEENILENGCLDSIKVWDNLIIDGHNRFEICETHGIDYRTFQIEFNHRDEVKAWIIRNQFGRRNLSAYTRSILALKLEDIISLQARARQAHGLTGPGKTLMQKSAEAINTRDELAQIAGVSHDTISKVKVIEERGTDDQKERLASGEESINAVYTKIKFAEQDALRLERFKNTKQPDLPDKKYRVIYADPPWQYGADFMDKYGHVGGHYKTMPVDEICNLPISELAAEDSVLFLWATSPQLQEAFKVIDAWSFTYKTSFVWYKVRHNFGYYNSVRHEFLLIATRGKCRPDIKKLHDSVVTIKRVGKHSEKPIYFRELIDKLYIYGKKIELFAREKVKGWDTWGAEVQDS